jgi:hypothetical protein
MSTARIARPRLNRFALLPAILLLTWGALSAAGVRLTPGSQAATAGSSTVTANVTADVQIGGTCVGYTGTNPSLLTTASATVLGTCTVTQSSNNNSATALRVKSSRTAAGTGPFCKTAIFPDNVTTCAGATKSFANVVAGSASLTDGQFGIKVAAAPTCSTATWTNGNYYPLPDAASAGSLICNTTAGTTGSYNLSFEADPAATQESGNYGTVANFTVSEL